MQFSERRLIKHIVKCFVKLLPIYVLRRFRHYIVTRTSKTNKNVTQCYFLLQDASILHITRTGLERVDYNPSELQPSGKEVYCLTFLVHKAN